MKNVSAIFDQSKVTIRSFLLGDKMFELYKLPGNEAG